MKLLARYLKPFVGILLVCLVLLFGQAACDLSLPTLMSDMVNVGIQQSGLEAGAPEAMRQEGLQLLSAFAGEEDRSLLEGGYYTIEPGSSEAQRFAEDYPLVREEAVCVLREGQTQEELDALIPLIDYTRLELDGDGLRARLPENMELDLGAVAKGYTGTYLAEQLRQAGVTSAILRLGGNIQAVGTRPDGNPWRVAIQDPDSQQEATLGVVEVSDQAVITSGGYQRYFEADGETYWHIMDPDTAAPARSGLTSVTVIGADGTVCDALSTALFVMGPEEAADFWRAHPELGVELILVLEDGTVQITQGLEETFTLSQDRTMEVIAP